MKSIHTSHCVGTDGLKEKCLVCASVSLMFPDHSFFLFFYRLRYAHLRRPKTYFYTACLGHRNRAGPRKKSEKTLLDQFKDRRTGHNIGRKIMKIASVQLALTCLISADDQNSTRTEALVVSCTPCSRQRTPKALAARGFAIARFRHLQRQDVGHRSQRCNSVRVDGNVRLGVVLLDVVKMGGFLKPRDFPVQ